MRTGLASTSVLALALLAGSPALAEDVPQIGQPCTQDTVLPTDLVCVDNLVAAAQAPASPDTPTTDPTPADPPAASSPSDPAPTAADPSPVVNVPAPPVDVPPATGGGGGGSAGSPVVVPGTGSGAVAPVGSGSTGQPNAGGSTTSPTTKPGSSLQASAAALDPASTTKSMLTAATVANLASGDLPTLAAMQALHVAPGTAGSPLSAYMPSPELANLPAATALSSVQAPLLAVGNDAANGGGFTLAGLSSRALPGLLVVLATALVSTVGAGNLRYWQERFGTRSR